MNQCVWSYFHTSLIERTFVFRATTCCNGVRGFVRCAVDVFPVWDATSFGERFAYVVVLRRPDLFRSLPTIYVRHASKETLPVMRKNVPAYVMCVCHTMYHADVSCRSYKVSCRHVMVCVIPCIMHMCHAWVSFAYVISCIMQTRHGACHLVYHADIPVLFLGKGKFRTH